MTLLSPLGIVAVFLSVLVGGTAGVALAHLVIVRRQRRR